MLVFAITDDRSSPDHPLGDAVETFIRREDAERFIEEVRRRRSRARRLPADRGAGARGGRAELTAFSRASGAATRGRARTPSSA